MADVLNLVEHRPLVAPDVLRFAQDMLADMNARGCVGLAYSLVRADGTTTHGFSSVAEAGGNQILLLGSMAVNLAAVSREADELSSSAPPIS